MEQKDDWGRRRRRREGVEEEEDGSEGGHRDKTREVRQSVREAGLGKEQMKERPVQNRPVMAAGASAGCS